MDIKAIAIDLDGTLLNSKKEITERTKEILKKVHKKGIKIIISTGRPYVSIKNLLNELEIKDMVIIYNGAKIIDLKNNEVIYEIPLEEKYVKYLIEISRKENIHLNLYQNEEWYVENLNNEETKKYKFLTNLIPIEKDFNTFEDYRMTKALYVGDNLKLKKIEEILKKEIGSEVYLTFSQEFLLEILNKKVNKGSALLYVLEQYNTSSEQCMAFGDAENDIEMLTSIKYGVAMKNALKKVKESVEYLTLSNDENGVVEFINTHVNLE